MTGASPTNPFQILGLREHMELAADEIERAALVRSAQLQPAIGSGDVEAEASLAAVNDARRVLANPETRATALLLLRGGPAASADKSLPPGFLMEMMEIREGIDEVAQSRDEQGLRKWRAWAGEQRAAYAHRVAELFRRPVSTESSAAIRRELNAWRYIERLIEQLDGGGAM
ncbi:MAG TPA: iron-sulfur cluster co-chaperone HscB C-terminal domain-containing protein [Phycisphaerales bacterium]|nr:iron-sulfur cluster co-chaperone HscB C-terminal domain-containing protein [Phycisphaerales bacterium]